MGGWRTSAVCVEPVFLELEMGWCGCGRFAELDDNRECSECRNDDKE